MTKEGSRRAELEKEGWTKQFISEEPRLSEFVELYESLGLEVRLEPVQPEDLESKCATCFQGESCPYRVIYTRDPKAVSFKRPS